MIVSIGTKIKDGPWGGGNLFAINLRKYLEKKGHKVINNLDDNDIDVILITEPRKTSESSAFSHVNVSRYLRYVNNKTLVAHRINECDERKGTNYVNNYMKYSNRFADQTIFVSNWLKNLYEDQGINKKNNSVVMAGADKDIFNTIDKKKWDGDSKIRLVTHHWGANWNKGFDIYSKLDEMLEHPRWSNKIEFTYIGNVPDKFTFKNAILINPLSGKELADEIKSNHIYVTGSLNEPSGNHHIEGAQCGLPILYVDSGGTTEYCKNFGIAINSDTLEEKLDEMINNYEHFFNILKQYPFSSETMCQEYLEIFEDMISNREKLISSRIESFQANSISKIFYSFFRSLI